VPGARLIVRNGDLIAEDNRRALAHRFARHGVERTRVAILPGTNRRGVLESYAMVDISLDTAPYCGGNTIAESLWQGVPVITLKGPRFSSAYGASLLTASGLADLVADSAGDYVRRAAALAADAERRAVCRSGLRCMVQEHGFSDADRFTRTLEHAYLDMMVRRNDRVPSALEGV
jgi:predicted O-linked N-acetylglucosamine transferase (SPINDLY family)